MSKQQRPNEQNSPMKVLVINAGSSSIKYQLYQMPQGQVICRGLLERIGEDSSRIRHQSDSREITTYAKVSNHEEGIQWILKALISEETKVLNDISEISAAGHRVVHGGEEFTGSVLIDDKVLSLSLNVFHLKRNSLD